MHQLVPDRIPEADEDWYEEPIEGKLEASKEGIEWLACLAFYKFNPETKKHNLVKSFTIENNVKETIQLKRRENNLKNEPIGYEYGDIIVWKRTLFAD